MERRVSLWGSSSFSSFSSSVFLSGSKCLHMTTQLSLLLRYILWVGFFPPAPILHTRRNLSRPTAQKYGFPENKMAYSEVIWTTPKAVLGVLPVLLIFGLWECSQHCYTTFVGVMSRCQFLTVLGVLPKVLYHFCVSVPTKLV